MKLLHSVDFQPEFMWPEDGMTVEAKNFSAQQPVRSALQWMMDKLTSFGFVADEPSVLRGLLEAAPQAAQVIDQNCGHQASHSKLLHQMVA